MEQPYQDGQDLGAPATALAFACPIPCIRCDYDLNAIPLTDPCPECGTPSADSLDSLAAAEPSDIRRVRVGILLLLIAGFGVPLLALCLILPLLFAAFGGGGAFSAFMLGLLMLCVGPAIALSGCIALNIPIARRHMPGLNRPQPAAHGTLAIKRFALTHFFLCVALGLSILIVSDLSPNGRGMQMVAGTFMALAILAWDFRNYFLCRSFAAIAQRASAPRAHTLFRWGGRVCSWLLIAHGLQGLAYLVLFLFSVSVDVTGSSQSPFVEQLEMVVIVLQSSLQFVTIAWCLAWPILLAILYRRLGRVYAFARAIDSPLVQPKTEPDALFYSSASAAPESPSPSQFRE